MTVSLTSHCNVPDYSGLTLPVRHKVHIYFVPARVKTQRDLNGVLCAIKRGGYPGGEKFVLLEFIQLVDPHLDPGIDRGTEPAIRMERFPALYETFPIERVVQPAAIRSRASKKPKSRYKRPVILLLSDYIHKNLYP